MAIDVLVLIDDGSKDTVGERFTERVPLPDKPVYATAGYSQKVEDILGEARLYRGPDGNVRAEITLLPSVSELSVQHLYPCIRGRVDSRRASATFTPDGKTETAWELSGVTLLSLGLLQNRNVDERIKTIGEQLKEVKP